MPISMNDLTALQEMAQHEVDEANSRSKERNDQYPVVYPGENGKLTCKMLYNPLFGGIQRKIWRHDGGKSKVACLQAYGEDCPVCAAIKEVEAVKGKEIGAFRKYGYKQRGICYAQIMLHDSAYFKEDKDPKKGDVVILMYPRTIYDQINKIIVDAGQHLPKLVAENEGIPIVIERSAKKGGFAEYKTYPYAYGAMKSFEDDAEKTGTQKFEEMIDSLPNLGENFTPKNPTDEIRRVNKALADVIMQEFMSGAVVNPQSDSQENNQQQSSESKPQTSSQNPTQTSGSGAMNAGLDAPKVQNSGGKPECYGNHQQTEKKCLVCPHECECFTDSGNG